MRVQYKKRDMTTVKELLTKTPVGSEVAVKGWVRTFRSRRFISLNDGSTPANIQGVVDFESFDEELLKKVNTGACVSIAGDLVSSQGQGQTVEIQVKDIEVLGEADPEQYPLQPKKHSLEFLRDIAHLRTRTATFSAVFRVRHAISFAIHKYFNDNGYYYINTPIITGSDAEGAGEMFRVTTLDADNTPRTEDGAVDYSQDFFGKETNLTVSGMRRS